ncbi:MAG: hypothetical protein PVSMB4_15650 [Ktedonobacterales bacterium]
MPILLTVLGLAGAAMPAPQCAPVPPLSYAPWVVGWWGIALCALDLAAGVACVGILGGRLRWTADDHAPLRALWGGLIVVGFATSAAGLYITIANRVHDQAVTQWLAHAGAECVTAAATNPSLVATTAGVSMRLGLLALVLIALGIAGAVMEHRATHRSKRE